MKNKSKKEPIVCPNCIEVNPTKGHKCDKEDMAIRRSFGSDFDSEY